ncbi:MAG: hypothetical protein OXH49_05840 [Gemmatimonadetes bacterium]|nr:hypothetical protein [Gemmatimonadota bacterium]
MLEAHGDLLGRVLQACGIPAPLAFDNADGTSQREAYRRWIMASVEPVAVMLAAEASEKLETDVRFDFTGVWAHDLQDRATAYASLTGAGMPPEAAREAVGI